jgi:mono/diheme cytochrome c family protein
MNLVLIALLLMAGAARADQPGPTFGNPYAFTEQSGEAIYHSVCAGCHMPDGKGATGAATYPSLNGDSMLATPAYPIHMVLKGLKAMPSLGRALSDAQVAAVVNYIRTHFGNRFADAVTAADVAAAR